MAYNLHCHIAEEGPMQYGGASTGNRILTSSKEGGALVRLLKAWSSSGGLTQARRQGEAGGGRGGRGVVPPITYWKCFAGVLHSSFHTPQG